MTADRWRPRLHRAGRQFRVSGAYAAREAVAGRRAGGHRAAATARVRELGASDALPLFMWADRMAPRPVLCLDLARRTGWCVGVPGGRPRYGTVEFRGKSHGVVYAALHAWLEEAIRRHAPAEIVAEAPLDPGRHLSDDAARLAFGMAAHVQLIALDHGVPLREEEVCATRERVLGRRAFPKGTAKSAVLAWCRAQGFAPHDDNAAELIAPTAENLSRKPGLVDTVRERPDMLAADASLQRLDLAENVGVLALATDAAETIQAQNSLEKMLAHQMAATHSVGMKMLAKADQFLTACKDWQPAGSQQMQIVEAARLTAAAARLLDSYQRAALTVERLRNGGKQTVVVQHVAVSEGGQAIVAGSMPVPGGRKRRERGAK